MLTKLLCLIGWHGPNVFGYLGHERSGRTAPFERTCSHCGAVWHGREISNSFMRSLGDWRRVK